MQRASEGTNGCSSCAFFPRTSAAE
jgi:hypothetical protein